MDTEKMISEKPSTTPAVRLGSKVLTRAGFAARVDSAILRNPYFMGV
jgi:hypothetical protein